MRRTNNKKVVNDVEYTQIEWTSPIGTTYLGGWISDRVQIHEQSQLSYIDEKTYLNGNILIGNNVIIQRSHINTDRYRLILDAVSMDDVSIHNKQVATVLNSTIKNSTLEGFRTLKDITIKSSVLRMNGNAHLTKGEIIAADWNYTPYEINLFYRIRFTPGFIQIGCEKHTTQEWEDFRPRQILAMNKKEAGNFWKKYKTFIISLSREYNNNPSYFVGSN